MDGLADTFDGLMSFRSKERALEIMKDSRIGTMGSLALIFVIALKWTALSAIASSSALHMALAVLLSVTIGRSACCALIYWMPYAREKGLGLIWAHWRGNKTLAIVGFGELFIPLLILAHFTGLWEMIFGALLLCMVLVLFLGYWFRSKLGGCTGDTYGAACELSETLALLVCAVVIETPVSE